MSITLASVLKPAAPAGGTAASTAHEQPPAAAPAAAPRLGQVSTAARTVGLTDSAVVQVRHLMTKEGRDPATTWLRLGVKGGGCSGLSYVIDFTDRKDALDVEFTVADIRMVVDRKSLIYLGGTQLDWLTGLKAGWNFGNPNQKKACSCGESFSV